MAPRQPVFCLVTQPEDLPLLLELDRGNGIYRVRFLDQCLDIREQLVSKHFR